MGRSKFISKSFYRRYFRCNIEYKRILDSFYNFSKRAKKELNISDVKIFSRVMDICEKYGGCFFKDFEFFFDYDTEKVVKFIFSDTKVKYFRRFSCIFKHFNNKVPIFNLLYDMDDRILENNGDYFFNFNELLFFKNLLNYFSDVNYVVDKSKSFKENIISYLIEKGIDSKFFSAIENVFSSYSEINIFSFFKYMIEKENINDEDIDYIRQLINFICCSEIFYKYDFYNHKGIAREVDVVKFTTEEKHIFNKLIKHIENGFFDFFVEKKLSFIIICQILASDNTILYKYRFSNPEYIKFLKKIIYMLPVRFPWSFDENFNYDIVFLNEKKLFFPVVNLHILGEFYEERKISPHDMQKFLNMGCGIDDILERNYLLCLYLVNFDFLRMKDISKALDVISSRSIDEIRDFNIFLNCIRKNINLFNFFRGILDDIFRATFKILFDGENLEFFGDLYSLMSSIDKINSKFNSVDDEANFVKECLTNKRIRELVIKGHNFF